MAYADFNVGKPQLPKQPILAAKNDKDSEKPKGQYNLPLESNGSNGDSFELSADKKKELYGKLLETDKNDPAEAYKEFIQMQKEAEAKWFEKLEKLATTIEKADDPGVEHTNPNLE